MTAPQAGLYLRYILVLRCYQCFFYWWIFAQFWPENYGFKLYKRISVGVKKNPQNFFTLIFASKFKSQTQLPPLGIDGQFHETFSFSRRKLCKISHSTFVLLLALYACSTLVHKVQCLWLHICVTPHKRKFDADTIDHG